jgi:hypothetical protein
MRGVNAIAAAMSATAPKRSTQAARLKKSHQITTNSAPATPPSTEYINPSGQTSGRPNRTSNCSVTAATPGHKRRGL